VLLGNVSVICRWLKVPEIADAVSLCPLRPYDLTDETDLMSFQQLLGTYDGIIPWHGAAPLVEHTHAINSAVSGCPVRLRKWVMDALIAAKARGRAELDWKFIESFAPLAQERKTAAADFTSIRDLRGPLPKAPASSAEKPDKKRFQRSLERNEVGFDAA
jgi:hypothetical protein